MTHPALRAVDQIQMNASVVHPSVITLRMVNASPVILRVPNARVQMTMIVSIADWEKF